jgi:hypothetical protein
MCVLSTTPDPACGSSPLIHDACAGAKQITCDETYRVAEQDCGSPSQCHVGVPDYAGSSSGLAPASCTLSADPDPRCTTLALATDGQWSMGCDGNVLFKCMNGWMIEATPCGSLVCGKDPPAQNGGPGSFFWPYCRPLG